MKSWIAAIAGTALFSAAGLASASANRADPANQTDPGTTIVGDQESAMGLTITPWKKEAAGDMDRAPRLYDEALAPIDADGFRAHSESYDTLLAYRRAQMRRVR